MPTVDLGKVVGDSGIIYGTCATAAATAAKTATITGFSLVTGASVIIKFTNANTAANPTLNVNSTGAKAIKKYGTTAAEKNMWAAGAVVQFVYDGTNWVMMSGIATKLAEGRTIQTDLGSTISATFDGSANISPGVTGILGTGNGGLGNSSGYVRAGMKADTTIGDRATAEGSSNMAGGIHAHAEGSITAACGHSSHSEGDAAMAISRRSHAEGLRTVTCDPSQIFKVVAYDTQSLTFDTEFLSFESAYAKLKPGDVIAVWDVNYVNSVVLVTIDSVGNNGITITSSFSTSVIPKYAFNVANINAGGNYSQHAEGASTIATGIGAHAEGFFTFATGMGAHAEGDHTTASGAYSHAGGSYSTASGTHACAHGDSVLAEFSGELAVGRYNVKKTPENGDGKDDLFAVGKGTSNTARANAFRVSHSGVYGTSAFNSTGADYAELFEWADGNPDKEDRRGRFVALDGEKIRLANSDDDFILGIISGAPSVIGDVHDDQWQGMFLCDIFGSPVWEYAEVPAVTEEQPDPDDPEKMITLEIIPAHMERRQKLNPDYDPSQKYTPRTERTEWGVVGMLGKLTVVDDGTCQINGWCKPADGGIATHSGERTRYRVMARLDDTHIRVLIL